MSCAAETRTAAPGLPGASQSCRFRYTHSFGKQVFNPLLQVLVLTELPNSDACKVRVSWQSRMRESVIEQISYWMRTDRE